ESVAHYGQPQRRGVFISEALAHLGRELMDVEIRGVDDDVGPMLEGLELCPFGFDAVEEGALSLQRVGPPGRFESADEDLIGGFEIDDSQRQSLVEEVRDRLLQLRVLRASL